jgi:hypothetical protein
LIPYDSVGWKVGCYVLCHVRSSKGLPTLATGFAPALSVLACLALNGELLVRGRLYGARCVAP